MMQSIKNPKIIAGMVALFLGSFLFFLYLSFPYGVLKEAIASQVQLATGMTLRMESFGPTFPLGFSADGVEIYKGSSARLKVKSMTVSLSVWQMFLARLGINIDVEDQKGGEIDLGIGFGVFDLLSGNGGLPSVVSMRAKSFEIDSLTAFAIQTAVDQGIGGPMAGPLLGKLGLRGKLSGTLDLSLNGKVLAQSSGDIKVQLRDSVLVLSDPSLNFPDQAFKMAQITANMASGTINVDPSTRFTTADLDMGVEGKVALRAQMANSDLSLKAFVRLQGLLGEQYGVLVDAISNGMSKNGSLNLQIAGTVGAPQINPI
jgi:type II secretion system protein N